MENYDHKKIEKKWQDFWKNSGIYKTPNKKRGAENRYILTEFAYPSGNLHVGHWYAFSVMDIFARYNRMLGYNVMFPMGFDAFGLPAENAAIKRNLNPRDWTYENISHMKNQLESMGASFDWSREVITCDPKYYKWTQWLFLELFKNNLAYQAKTKVNWCPSCKTVLANEQVNSGACERCDFEVEQKDMKQWMIKITNYADRLIDDLETLNWPEEIKTAQKNWIGRSEGAEIEFEIKGGGKKIKVFTTRPDTLFGVTYLVLAPDNKEVVNLKSEIINWNEVEEYVKKTNKKTELERLVDVKDKTGVELKGIKAINPGGGEEIPVFIADYVLAHYGTGAIMAVPAHDERDMEFAQKFNLNIKNVVSENGTLLNSGDFDGLTSEEAKEKITKSVDGEMKNTYKLRDWLVSRQRYWGCPIPIIHCEKCGTVDVPQKDLPVELPNIDNFLPRDDGKSPLSKASDWVSVKCPKCNNKAERETDTLDTFMDSSWYFLRYTDPHNKKEFASKRKMNKWMPVDFYSGGAEHTTMHLLYSRFFQKALFDLRLVKDPEPYKVRMNRGLILGPDGNKMSKSKGNVIDPDEIVERLGADTVRMYLAFIGPYNEVGSYPWDPNGVVGVRRFLEKIWKLKANLSEETELDLKKNLHKTIKKVSEDMPKLKFNTALASMMTFLNLADKKELSKEDFNLFLKILAPFAPHLTEELKIETSKSIHSQSWPVWENDLIINESIKYAVQVNGKLRGEFEVENGKTEDYIQKKALDLESVKKWIDKKEIIKIIVINNKLVNIVVKDLK